MTVLEYWPAFLFSLIIVIHELGHFLAGRFFKFKITQFSIAGPVLFEREKNGIRYNIKAFPIGASVSLREMCRRSKERKRILTLILTTPIFSLTSRAGSVRSLSRWAQFISDAFLVFTIIFTTQGRLRP